jgi:hypothetical protein
MNNHDNVSHESLPSDKIRKIPNWTRSYAQNRTLPFLVLIAAYSLVCYGTGHFAQLTGEAYRAGQMLAFSLRLAALVICCGAIVALAVPNVTKRLQRQLMELCYGDEGEAMIVSSPISPLWRWSVYFFFLLFAVGIPAQVLLGSRIAEAYQQPISALYFVPFMVVLGLAMRPRVGLLNLIWPFLYGLHAVLILAGAPILFGGKWSDLNIGLPIFGYGVLSALIGHGYNRYSLWRLRRLGAAGREKEASRSSRQL